VFKMSVLTEVWLLHWGTLSSMQMQGSQVQMCEPGVQICKIVNTKCETCYVFVQFSDQRRLSMLTNS
jgi:hypothetical protein